MVLHKQLRVVDKDTICTVTNQSGGVLLKGTPDVLLTESTYKGAFVKHVSISNNGLKIIVKCKEDV